MPAPTLSFVQYQPHANAHDRKLNPALYFVRLFMNLLLASVLTFFVIHTILWLVRSRLRPGQEKVGGRRPPCLIWFNPPQTELHQRRPPKAATSSASPPRSAPCTRFCSARFLAWRPLGLPLRFSESIWARGLARAVGGFGAILFFHKFCALVLTLAFLVHVKDLVQRVLAIARRESSGAPPRWWPTGRT